VTERRIEIVNRLGLHARAAAKLVHLAGAYEADVKLVRDGEEVDGKSILGILMLAAPQGTTVTIRCNGLDEKEACEAVADLFARGFDEEG
jgi:phosphocarrier protein